MAAQLNYGSGSFGVFVERALRETYCRFVDRVVTLVTAIVDVDPN